VKVGEKITYLISFCDWLIAERAFCFSSFGFLNFDKVDRNVYDIDVHCYYKWPSIISMVSGHFSFAFSILAYDNAEISGFHAHQVLCV
jgi:hypothetical protein